MRSVPRGTSGERALRTREDVARGASIMTDTSVECELSMAFTEYLPNNALAAVADECLQEVGAPEWTEA